MIIDIQKEINPHFKEVWTSDKPYNILKGGRNSFKSSVVALSLIKQMIQVISREDNNKCNVVVIRKVANTIRDSVYLKIKWAIEKYGLLSDFEMTVAPFKIKHKATGSAIYFYGADDFQKLKSNDIGNIIGVWYEECGEFKSKEEFDQINPTFMRQKHPDLNTVKFYWTYNPPRNPYHWINEWAEELKDSNAHLIHESSYLNDELGFVTKQMLEEIERIKQNDIDYYKYIYLGMPVGLGTNVYNFNLFKVVDKVPDNEYITLIDIASDTGHQTSATVHLAVGLSHTGNVYLLDTYYYSPANKAVKKAPSEMSKEYYEFYKSIANKWGKPIDNMTIDSAEGALRNQLFLDYGIRLHPVAKKKKVEMIDFVHTLLAEGRVHVLNVPNNQIFLEEHKKFMWEEKSLKTEDPKVVKDDDHSCDAFIYYVLDNSQKLGLKL